MPLYEYRCTVCGLRFERRQHFDDPPIEVCPECGGKVVRLIQPAGVIFKGSGFYVTDNRAKSSISTPGSRKEKGEGKAKATSGEKKGGKESVEKPA